VLAATNTRERTLDARECLFDAHGFAGASLRVVTSEAEVNLAAVHYHLGVRREP
jgi:AcrR family transcriptional regulator